MNDLLGKVSLVTGTGGERGIGRAIAMRLAAAGADVIVADLTDQPPVATGWQGLRQVVGDIERLGRRAAGDRVPIVDLCCRAVARSMFQRPGDCHGGRIINIASTAGKTGIPR